MLLFQNILYYCLSVTDKVAVESLCKTDLVFTVKKKGSLPTVDYVTRLGLCKYHCKYIKPEYSAFVTGCV
jgi:hypothetical protein